LARKVLPGVQRGTSRSAPQGPPPTPFPSSHRPPRRAFNRRWLWLTTALAAWDIWDADGRFLAPLPFRPLSDAEGPSPRTVMRAVPTLCPRTATAWTAIV